MKTQILFILSALIIFASCEDKNAKKVSQYNVELESIAQFYIDKGVPAEYVNDLKDRGTTSYTSEIIFWFHDDGIPAELLNQFPEAITYEEISSCLESPFQKRKIKELIELSKKYPDFRLEEANYFGKIKLKNVERARKIRSFCPGLRNGVVSLELYKLADTKIPLDFIKKTMKIPPYTILSFIQDLYNYSNRDKLIQVSERLANIKRYGYEDLKKIVEENISVDFLNKYSDDFSFSQLALFAKHTLFDEEVDLFKKYSEHFGKRMSPELFANKTEGNLTYFINCLKIGLNCDVWLSTEDIIIFHKTKTPLHKVKNLCLQARANNQSS